MNLQNLIQTTCRCRVSEFSTHPASLCVLPKPSNLKVESLQDDQTLDQKTRVLHSGAGDSREHRHMDRDGGSMGEGDSLVCREGNHQGQDAGLQLVLQFVKQEHHDTVR